MSQERYLQIKKEHQVRKFVGRFLFILLAILDVLLVSSHSNYVPLVTVAMVTIPTSSPRVTVKIPSMTMTQLKAT